MTKRIFALLLALMLLTGVSLAETLYALPETEENASVTYEELDMYLSSLPADSLHDLEPVFPGAVRVASLSAEQADPRGLRLGDTLQQILAVYPCDNPDLLGSYYDAALYVNSEQPDACVGFLLRDGQRVTDVCYYAFHWQEDGVANADIWYELDQGVIVGITVSCWDEPSTEEEALEEIRDIADLQEIADYFAYPQSEYGLDLSMFQREDLSFAGVDFLDLTAEAAVDAFGPAAGDDWAEDSTGEWLRILSWDGVSLILVYDADRQFLRVDSLTVSADVLEGPRGVRVGDYLDTVIFRFRHSEGGVNDVGMTLYGDGETAPYGLMDYSAEGAALTYALALEDGKTVLFYLTFNGELLDSMCLLQR